MHLVISNDSAPSLREFASWQFEASGNYAADLERARALAAQFLKRAGESGFENILGWIVGSIAKRRGGTDLTGLEIGFMAALSRRLAAPTGPSGPDDGEREDDTISERMEGARRIDVAPFRPRPPLLRAA